MTSGGMGRKARWRATLAAATRAALPLPGALPAAAAAPGMPYAGNSLAQCYGLSVSPNRDVTADAEINLTSHEQMESATDPEASGWFGPGGLTYEIADKCLGVFGPLNAKGGDVYFKGHPYILQEEWDNAVSGCVLTGP